MRIVKVEEYKEIAKKFQPIPDLKPGDKVKLKENQKYVRTVNYGDVVTVHSTELAHQPQSAGAPYYRPDFSYLTIDEDTTVYEFQADSRYFERVTD